MHHASNAFLAHVSDVMKANNMAIISPFGEQPDFALTCQGKELARHIEYHQKRMVIIAVKKGLKVNTIPSPSHGNFDIVPCTKCWGDNDSCSYCDGNGQVFATVDRSCSNCMGSGLRSSFARMPIPCHCYSHLAPFVASRTKGPSVARTGVRLSA